MLILRRIDCMKIDEAIMLVQSQLSIKRFEHTMRVAETAKELAHLYHVDLQKAELAAILHDYAKDFPVNKLKQILMEGHFPQDLLHYDKELWHGPVGAYILRTEYGISDTDILHAVRFHTTGRSKMSKLELIIYVADYIEPGRQFPAVHEVRTIAQEDLFKAAWAVSRNTIQFLLKKNTLVYPDTINVYNDLTRRLCEEHK